MKTINKTSLTFEDTPFHYGPQSELPELHSEPASEQYLDDMDESPQVPQDIDIEKLTFDLDQDFNHLYPQIKQLHIIKIITARIRNSFLVLTTAIQNHRRGYRRNSNFCMGS